MLLKECRYPQGGGHPLGILHTLATENFELRMIALERDFLGFLGNLLTTNNLGLFVFLARITIMKIELLALVLSPYGPETMPIL